jgi:hypothetical protein
MLHTPGVFSPRSSFTGKEISKFPRRKANRLDIVPGQHRADAIESRVDKEKKGDRNGYLRGISDSRRWIDGPSDLSVTAAVPLEIVLQKILPIMESFVITQGSGLMYQLVNRSLFFGRVVLRVGMEIEIGVCRFMVNSMSQ